MVQEALYMAADLVCDEYNQSPDYKYSVSKINDNVCVAVCNMNTLNKEIEIVFTKTNSDKYNTVNTKLYDMSSVFTHALYQTVSVSLARNIVKKLNEMIGRDETENIVVSPMKFNFEIVNEQNQQTMCKYCEALTSDKMDAYKHKYRKLLPTKTDSNDIGDWEVMACIIPPTPISKRRHKDDGYVSTIDVYFADDKRRVTNINIPVKYCPMCGKEIK